MIDQGKSYAVRVDVNWFILDLPITVNIRHWTWVSTLHVPIQTLLPDWLVIEQLLSHWLWGKWWGLHINTPTRQLGKDFIKLCPELELHSTSFLPITLVQKNNSKLTTLRILSKMGVDLENGHAQQHGKVTSMENDDPWELPELKINTVKWSGKP